MNIKLYMLIAMLGLSSLSMVNSQNTLTIEACRAKAVEHNKELKKANYQTEEAKANQKVARTAFLPSISASAMLMNSPKSESISTPGGFLPTADSEAQALAGEFTGISNVYSPGMSMNLDYLNLFAADVSVMQVIYAGGAIRNTNKMADIGVELANENYQLKYSEIIEQTDKAFWQIAMIEANTTLIKSYITMLTNLENQMAKMYELELIPKSEKLKVSVQKNETELNLLKVHNALKISKMYLNQIMGNDLSADITITYEALQADILNTTGGVELAINNRVELQMLSNQISLAEYNKKIAKAEYLPSFGVGLQYYTFNIHDVTDTWEMRPMISAKLSVPIFAWGKGSKQQKANDFVIKQHQEDLSNTQDLINLEVLKVKVQLEEAYQSIGIAKKNIAQAEESLEETKASFDAGLNSTTDMLNAQANWQNTQSQLITAMAEYKVLQTTWAKVTGGLVAPQYSN